MKTYEGMFLLEAGQPSFDEAAQPVRSVLERSGAEVLQLKKWDERRLAFEIRGRRRGLYVLAYFKVAPEKVAEIEHDVRLNEKILRLLILSADHMSAEEMAAPTPAEVDPSRREREDEGEDWRDRRPRRPERRFGAETEVAVDIVSEEADESSQKEE